MTLFRRTALLLVPAVLASCAAPGPEVRADYDHDADFARFRTFGWAAPRGTDQASYATLTTERLEAAVRYQMESRGYVFVRDRPDLLVNFHIRPERRTETEVARAGGPRFAPWGYYDYRFYEPWPAWRFGSEEVISHYTPGTLNIDLVDRARNRLVWEGVAIGPFTRNDLDNPGGKIDRTVADIFERYPFGAGGGTPAPARR